MNNVVRPAFHVDRELLGHFKQTAPAELSFNSEACHLAMNLFGVILLARLPGPRDPRREQTRVVLTAWTSTPFQDRSQYVGCPRHLGVGRSGLHGWNVSPKNGLVAILREADMRAAGQDGVELRNM